MALQIEPGARGGIHTRTSIYPHAAGDVLSLICMDSAVNEYVWCFTIQHQNERSGFCMALPISFTWWPVRHRSGVAPHNARPTACAHAGMCSTCSPCDDGCFSSCGTVGVRLAVAGLPFRVVIVQASNDWSRLPDICHHALLRIATAHHQHEAALPLAFKLLLASSSVNAAAC